ncbi:zinc-binding dehydrogenase [Brachybacterium sp. GPGPB12]|uniref:zinc-dependent alcohol dehydrogenase n=1 Tax=Brachybacterium sp. GPGPB12 TaxID=3023517 RepID=UPI00313463B6
MRALVLTDFHQLDLVDVERPEPGAGEVSLRICATGICGSDFHGFTGENGRRVPGQIMGHESSGRIAALGEGVDAAALPLGAPATFNPVVVPPEQAEEYRGREQDAPGKQVIGVAAARAASFADYVVVPARNVLLLDPAMPPHLGALIEPLAVAVHAVGLAAPSPEERALVVGGGPIGQSVVLALQRAGLTAIAVSEPDPRRRELLASLGASALDPAAGPMADQLAEVLGGPADLAVDAVGVTPTLADGLTATRLGARIVLVGMGSPRLELAAFAVSTEERTIHGSFTYTAQDFADATAWIGEHAEQAAALVSEVVPPEQAHDAFTALAAGKGPAGKILVRFDAEEVSAA